MMSRNSKNTNLHQLSENKYRFWVGAAVYERVKNLAKMYANTKQDPSILSSSYSQNHLRENALRPVSLNTGLQKPRSFMIRDFGVLRYLSFMVGLFQSA